MEHIEQAEYFRRRAEEEHAAAEQADDERAAQTHRALAARYEAKAQGSLLRDVGRDVPEEPGILSSEFTILP